MSRILDIADVVNECEVDSPLDCILAFLRLQLEAVPGLIVQPKGTKDVLLVAELRPA